MPALTSAPGLPWLLCPWILSPRERRSAQATQRLATRNPPQSLDTLQAQAQSQNRAEDAALWEVMMRPA